MANGPVSASPEETWDPLQSVPSRSRWAATGFMAVLTTAVLASVLLSAWADRVLLNEDRFSARIASTLRQDEMNSYLAGELTEQVLARVPELMSVRPAIEAVLSETLRTRTAIVGARAALREAHRSVRSGQAEESINIDLQAVITLATALMQRGAPDVAERFEAGLDTTRIDASAIGLRTNLFERLELLTRFTLPLAGLSVVMMGSLVALAPTRRSGVMVGAVVLVATGVFGLAGQRLAEVWFVELLPEREEARQAVTLAWRSVLREYRGWNAGLLALGIAAAVGAAAAGHIPSRAEVLDFFQRSPWARTTGGVGLALAGLAVARWPLDTVQVIVIALGVVLAGAGVFLLLRNALAAIQGVRPSEYAERVHGARVLLTAYAVIAVFLVGAGVSIWFATTVQTEASPVEPAPITVCNGHELLCDRPLNEITFPGTHNSMSASSERGWFFPSQRYSIAQQLRDGVRALLIDTYYGIPATQAGVLTVINEEKRRPELVAEHGEEVVVAAEHIASTLRREGEPQIYLCHSFCELGATPMSAALVDIRDYLDAHPGEFLLLIVQDQTAAEDTMREFELADLADRAYAHPVDEPWPTLGELLAEGKQLLVMAEHNGGEDWYQRAFDEADGPGLLGETRFEAPTPASLMCEPGRGGPEQPLFLLNHWVTERPPSPSRALEVNTEEFLLDRARTCAEDWGRVPNVVAVDFYDVGDVFEAVAELNGIPEDEVPVVGSSAQ